jgi:hypothetical protein
MTSYASRVNTNYRFPINQPYGNATVLNDSGGYGYQLTDTEIIKRFLILGSVGTYYANSQISFQRNLDAIRTAIINNGVDVVRLIEQMVLKVPSKAPSLFVLALAKVLGDAETRKEVYRVVRQKGVIAHAGQLQDFLLNLNILGDGQIPNGMGFRKAIIAWFLSHEPKSLLYQAMKYRNRSMKNDGNQIHMNWRDMLRLFRPSPKNIAKDAHDFDQIFSYLVKGELKEGVSISEGIASFVAGFEEIQKTDDLMRVLELIRHHNFTWEYVPNTWFSDEKSSARKAIWTELLQKMPFMATIRNITRFAEYGILDDATSRKLLINRLTDEKTVVSSGIHPVAVFNTIRIYTQGRNSFGKKWDVNPSIEDALDICYKLSYKAMTPIEGSTIIFLDISGSMSHASVDSMADLPVMHAGGILAHTVAYNTTDYRIVGFGSHLEKLDIRASQSITDVLSYLENIPYHNSTKISLCFDYLLEEQIKYDNIIILTDNESWAGEHCDPLFARYLKFNPSARLAYIPLVANLASMDNPEQSRSVEFVGFSADLPAVLSVFFNELK